MLLCLPGAAWGQQGLGPGLWRYHSYFGRCNLLALSPATAYASGGNSVMTYDRASGDISTLTKVDGLSEVSVTALAHAYDREILVIGYRSGGIDIVQGRRVTTITGLRLADISADKAILGLDIIGKYAFASGAFGFLVLDLERREVKYANTSLDLSGSNQPVGVSSVCLSGGVYYFATGQGVLSVPAGSNLQDSRQFTRLTAGLPRPFDLRSVAASGGYVYALSEAAGVFYLDPATQTWQNLAGGVIASVPFRSLRALNDRVILSAGAEVYRIHDNTWTQLAKRDTLLGAPFVTLQDRGGEFYSASMTGALVRYLDADASLVSIKTSSPGFASPFSLYGYNDRMVTLPGGYESSFYGQFDRTDGLSIFQNNDWRYVPPTIPGKPEPIRDMSSASYSKATQELYVGTYGNGIFVLPDDTARRPYLITDTTRTRDGNTLGSVIPTLPGRFVRVPGLSFDDLGNLWVAQYYDSPLQLRDLSRNWFTYTPPYANRGSTLDVYVDNLNNYRYVRIAPKRGTTGATNSVMVFDVLNKRWATINNTESSGALPNPDVYDCAVDRAGTLWMCTGTGVAALYDPTVVFGGAAYAVTLPIFDGRYLLENDICTAITLDGGDRKWIGTRRSGIWLFDKEVTKLLAHYTTDNSPLPSNNIADLAVLPKTGELFVNTEEGLVSLSTEATDAALSEASNSCVRVVPNPVRPDYQGKIAIDCLPENAVVKITDAAGRLVYEAKAAGGGLIWNGLDYQGRRPQPGVYLIYAYSDSKSAKVVGRFAMVE